MSAQRLASSYVRYPFGKLIPIIPKVAQVLSLKRRNWAENWQCAINEEDFQSVLALSMLITGWRQSELFYKVKREDIKIHGKQNYAQLICQTFFLITTNRQSNHKVALILVELLQFYYTKFRSFKEFLYFGELIEEMIEKTQKFIVFFCGSDEKQKPETIQQMFDLAEGKIIRENLANLIDFLGKYDGKKKKDPGPGQRPNDPSEESRQQAQPVVHYLIETSCMPHFLSTLVYLKIHFLRFFNMLYEQEFAKYRQTTKAERQLKLEIRMRNKQAREENPRKFSQQVTAEEIDPLHDSPLEREMESPLGYVRHVFQLASKTGTKPKLFFAYINPVMRYLPLLMVSCSSCEERILVFEKIFLPIIEHIIKIYDEKKNEHSFFIKYKQVSLFTYFDLVPAFRENSLLNDLQMALVAYFEQQVKQHKQVEEYTQEYMEIQKYFQLLANLKKKVIKGLQQLKETFQYEWPFLSFFENKKPLSQTKENENKNSQTQLDCENTKTITTKHKRLNAALNGVKLSESPQNMNQKKSNQKSRGRNKNNFMDNMPNIPEESDEDDETDAGEEINPLKKTKSLPKKSLKPRKSKKAERSSSNQSISDEDSEQLLTLQPLEQKKPTESFIPAQSSSSLPKNKKGSKTSQPPVQQRSEKVRYEQEKEILPQYFNKRPLIIRQKQYLAYIQHHSNPYNSLSIFRQHAIKYEIPSINSVQKHYGQQFYRFPTFIDINFYFAPYRCQIYNHYDKIRLAKKSTACHDEAYHKKLMKEIFIETEILDNRIKDFNEMVKQNKSQLTKNQIENERQIWLKIDNEIIKKKILSFYIFFKNIKLPEHTVGIEISLFPLTNTHYGQQVLKALTKCIQEFFFYLTNKEKHIEKTKMNKYNTRLLSIRQMIEIDVEKENFRENYQLFMSILFETLYVLKKSENFEALKFFYENFYKHIPIYMKSILLFYMYEMEYKKIFQLKQLLCALLKNNLKTQDFIDVMNFFTRDSKLISIQMKFMYKQMFQILDESCYKMIDQVEDLLCGQIVPRVKFEGDSSLQRSNFRRESPQYLETLKEKYYVKFGQLVDLLNLWTVINFSSQIYEQKIPSERVQPLSRIPLMYFCKNCHGSQKVDFSIRREANYQSYLCAYCSNSVLQRFQIFSTEIHFDYPDLSINMQGFIEALRNHLKGVLKKYEWKVKPMPYLKYQLGRKMKARNLMEVEQDQYLSQQQQNVSQRAQNSSRGQASRNESPASNRSNVGSSYKNRYRQIVENSRKPEKSVEEEIQQDNEEFCYNSLNILVCYCNHMKQLLDKAL